MFVKTKGVLVVEDIGARRDRGGSASVQALEHVANEPILHHVLDGLEAAGVVDITVISSTEFSCDVRASLDEHRGDPSSRLRYVAQPAPVDLVRAMNLAAPMVGDAPCVVHLGDGLLGEPLAPLIARVPGDTPDMAVIVHDATAPDRPMSTDAWDLLHITALTPVRSALGVAGVWLFGPGALRRIGATAWRCDDDTDRDVSAIAKRIVAAGGTCHVLVAEAWRRYAGNAFDLLELNRIALDRMVPDHRRPTNSGNRIEGRVWIHEQAVVHESVIVGPAVIGAGAFIADAYIGPYTSVGSGVRIEGAEIERSIIASGASIMHIGGRIAASVVGRDARIFREFSLPRAMRLCVGAGTEVALC